MHKVLVSLILLTNIFYTSDSTQESKEIIVSKIGTISILRKMGFIDPINEQVSLSLSPTFPHVKGWKNIINPITCKSHCCRKTLVLMGMYCTLEYAGVEGFYICMCVKNLNFLYSLIYNQINLKKASMLAR